MARKRRIIRKIYPDTQRWFGEQMWPLVVAMFVLGGFLAGTVLAYLRLDTPYWYANAWTWLIAIPLVIAAALTALAYTSNRLLRRTMQLAMVLCAIVHLTLFIVAIETDVFHRVWMEMLADTDQVQEKKVVTVPVYSSLQHDSQKFAASDFEQPVETKLPEPTAEQVDQRQPDHKPETTKPETTKPEPSPETEQSIRPNVVRRTEPSRVIPRQDIRASTLSRKVGEVPSKPNQQVQLPDINVRPPQQPMAQAARMPAARAPGTRTMLPPAMTRQQPSSQLPEVSNQARPTQLARKTTQEKPHPESPSAATFTRRVARPSAVPRLDVQSNSQPTVARMTHPAAIQPSNTLARKQQTRSPQADPQVSDPARDLAPRITSRRQSSQQPTPERPTLARAPESASNRKPRMTTRPPMTSAVAETTPQSASSNASAERPASITRPANQSRDLPSAARLALTKANTGVAGSGHSHNLGQSEPAPDKPATIASGSARRAKATQTMPAGPALSPRDTALVRQKHAGRSKPSATLRATQLNLAALPGSRDPSDVHASSSASLVRAASDATSGPITATKGSIDVDLGPTTIVAASGSGRAAGGGQPRLSTGVDQKIPKRRRSGPTISPSSLVETQAAEAPTDPATEPVDSIAPLATRDATRNMGGRPAENKPPVADDLTIHNVIGPSTISDALSTGSLPTGSVATRAEAAQADPGPVEIGGGTRSPKVLARGPKLRTSTQAESVEIAGASQSAGQKMAEPANAQGPTPSRLAGGLNLPRNATPVGAIAADVLADAQGTALPSLGQLEREASPTDRSEPTMRDANQLSGPGKRSRDFRPPSLAEELVVPNPPAGNLDPSSIAKDSSLAIGQPNPGPARRQAGLSLPVDVPAVEGPGGLGTEASRQIGLARRRIRDQSPDMQLETSRFLRKRVGGLPDLSTTSSVAAEPYRRRMERGSGMGGGEDSPSPQTEEAIELGLVFLARSQSADGAWRLNQFAHLDGLPQMASDTAATGLALLAFQGAGYHHRGHRYAEVVGRAIDFLVKNQQDDGGLFIPMDPDSNRVVQFYSHGIAALALSEAYGMTQDPELREAAQKALDFIVKTQNPNRGGWRYTPQLGSDTSVTGWMVMALKSGELADLKVPEKTYAGIRNWLDRARASASEPYIFCYNPYAPDTITQRRGRKPTTTMTSVGLLMQLYLGSRRDHPLMSQGADVLLKSLPAVGTPTNPQRDTYYWYYATQVMFHMGGRHWKTWNEQLHPLLINTQIRDGDLAGSWDPKLPIRDRWAPHAGRLYVTTMNLLSLEVTYRYLPVYEDTAR